MNGDKHYTAEEMRTTANFMCTDITFARIPVQYKRPLYREVKTYEVAAMLRQAADEMEREKKYEFSVHPPEVNGVFQYRAGAELKAFMLKFDGCRDGIIVRREVGEWEEVKE